MSTQSSRNTSRRGPGGVAVVVLAAALVAVGGCEMLGLGGGTQAGGEQKAPKRAPTGGGGSDTGTAGPTATGSGSDVGTTSPPSLGGGSGDAGGARRNPFAPKVDLEQDEEEEEPTEGVKKVGPLKRRPLSEYQLVGIISEVAVPKAMFIAPDGKGYLIKESEAIGSEGGVIGDIRSNAVEVDVPREGGGTKTMTLKLRKRELSSTDESELSPRERETLEELMKSEQGREAIRKSLGDESSSSESGQQPPRERRRRPAGDRRRNEDVDRGRLPPQ